MSSEAGFVNVHVNDSASAHRGVWTKENGAPDGICLKNEST